VGKFSQYESGNKNGGGGLRYQEICRHWPEETIRDTSSVKRMEWGEQRTVIRINGVEEKNGEEGRHYKLRDIIVI
jgi:hypothetical protein